MKILETVGSDTEYFTAVLIPALNNVNTGIHEVPRDFIYLLEGQEKGLNLDLKRKLLVRLGAEMPFAP